ncbi:hypothetical protein PG984_002528 [Apiospora sp. TS-2023a]
MLSRRLLTRGGAHWRPQLTAANKPARAVHGIRFNSSGGGGPRSRIAGNIPSVIGALAGASSYIAYREWTDGGVSKKPSATAVAVPARGIPNLDDQGKGWRADQVKYAPAPSSEDVTAMLNEGAASYSIGTVSSVANYDVAQLASNSPIEDAYVHGRFSSPFKGSGGAGEEDWMAWAVFDGHCGWQTSNLLTKQLMPFVQKSLRDIGKPNPTDADIQQALQTAFTKLDDMLVTSAQATIEGDHSFPDKVRRLEPAFAGSCALLALYNPTTKSLHIASTGDCRAVIGSKDANNNNKWTTTFETVDQTGANEDEKARIQKQFPDEPQILAGGRIWGMQPARTFGDGGWKWDKDLRARLRREYNATALPSSVRYSGYKTGPYLTALPVVSTVKLPEAPSFMILATDGLWDTMSSEEAVDLVGRWTERKKGKLFSSSTAPPTTTAPNVFGDIACRYDNDFSTFQDPNAAVHLMRNGLGGARDELVRGALAFTSPAARYIRDDMTVQVVFFGDNQ